MPGLWSRAACLTAFAALVGCGGLVNVRYDKLPLVTSTRSAEVRLVSGIVGGEPVPVLLGPLLIPMPVLPSSRLAFNVDDQRTFILSLIDELNRLKILNAHEAAEQPPERAEVSIQIAFLRTDERSAGTIYTLDVELLLNSNGQNKTERYTIISSEGESDYQRQWTSPARAKEMAATKLLAVVIPDIEKFLAREK
jgi:hypothetical protein